MIEFFAQQRYEPSLFNAPPASVEIWIKILVTAVIGFAIAIGLSFLPSRARRPVIATFTFIAGFYYVLLWIWPKAQDRTPLDIPRNAVEGVAFALEDLLPVVTPVTQVIVGFLLLLGVYSVLRIHLGRMVKMQKDWQFSLILLISMAVMVFFGFWPWLRELKDPTLAELENWGVAEYGKDFLFDGLLQQMDAAMFSMIAFFILSAAYRAFRIRSAEATILLATALILMLSLMGGVEYLWGEMIGLITKGEPGSFANNFTLTSISRWISDYLQQPAIRGLAFGVGIGALAMGLRLWLSLEKGGVSA